MRYPTTALGTLPTAVLALRETINLNWKTHDTARQMMMLTASPVAPVWIWRTALAHRYSYTGAHATGQARPHVLVATELITDDENPAFFLQADSSAARFAYVPPTSYAVTIKGVSSGATAGSVTILYSHWNGHEVRDGKQAFTIPVPANTAATTELEIPIGSASGHDNGWISLLTATPQGSGVAFTATTIEAGVVVYTSNNAYPAMLLPEISTNDVVLHNTRVNAAGLLVTNTSPEYYKNGTVSAARLTATGGGNAELTNPFDFVTMGSRIEATNRDLRYDGAAKDGIYTFFAPTEGSMDYSDYMPQTNGFDWKNTLGTVTKKGYLLNAADFGTVNFIRFNCDVTNGLTFKVRYDVHLEYITSSQLFNLGTPILQPTQFQAMCSAANSMVPFTENPLHIAELAALGKMLFDRFMPIVAPYARRAVKQAAGTADAWLARY